MRFWPLAAIPVAYLLQVSLAGQFGPLHAVPDLPLLLAAFAGLLLGPDRGAVTGFFVGLLQDLSLSRYVGLRALSRAASGYAAGYLGSRVLPDNMAVPFLVGLGATLFDNIVTYVILRASGASVFVLHRPGLVLTASLYNAFLGPVVFTIISGVNSRNSTAQGKM